MEKNYIDIKWSTLNKIKLLYNIFIWSMLYGYFSHPWHMILLYKRLNIENITSKQCWYIIKTTIGYKGFFRGCPIFTIGILIADLGFMINYEYLKENTNNEFISGIISHTLVLPINNFTSLISTKQMITVLNTNNNLKYMSAWKTTTYIYNKTGFTGMFKGCGLSMIYMPVYGLWWKIYETSKKYLYKTTQINNDIIINSMSGGFAGITTGILLNPLDVVYTKYQAIGEKKLIKMSFNMYKKNGIKWFYRGFILDSTQRLCENSLFSVIYDSIKKYSANTNKKN